MPNDTVILDYFSKLEEVSVSDIQQWLPQPEDAIILENKIGNRMLYPQVIPQAAKDLAFNFAIIRKVIEKNQDKFYNKNLKKIEIPEGFLQYFPDIQKLVTIFIDAILPPGITAFWLKSLNLGPKNLGTLIRPDNLGAGSIVTIGVGGKQYQIKAGAMATIPITQSRADITFTSASATLMDKKVLSIEVVTGQLGLMVDARIS
ncbi:MAG: hypothetical protein PHQ59_04855 [Candidatus Daviesbacteria bacterium]|nr:hypothetical protein [Candidatus Daviesbacteria bacterium]